MTQETLPEGWRSVCLETVSDIVMGQSPPSCYYNATGDGMPFLQGKAEFADTHPTPSKYCTKPLKVAKCGTVLISVRAPVGDANIADVDYVIGRGLASISLREGDNSYLFYMLTHQKPRIQALGSGTTFQSINRDVLDRLRIPLPPLPEQKAIAKALGAVQRARDARKREIELERERKAALMDYLFTHGTRNEPTRTTDIGEMPGSWAQANLGALIREGPQNGLYKPADLYGRGTPIVRIDAFDNEGMFTSMDFQRVQLEKADIDRWSLDTGDILINRVNSMSHLGKSVLVPELTEPTVFESNMMRFRVDYDRVLPEFVARYLMTEPGKTRIKAMARHAVAQSSINQGDVNSLVLPMPSLEEQKEIVEVLDRCDAKIAALEKESALLDELFRAMLEELMTGRLSAVPLIED